MRVLLVLGFVVLSACAALRDDMRRAETSFEAARYEDVLVWLDDLEPHVAEMDQTMRARFYYLRGITAFRLGRRSEARLSKSSARGFCVPRPDQFKSRVRMAEMASFVASFRFLRSAVSACSDGVRIARRSR
jgi:hypothetical protein